MRGVKISENRRRILDMLSEGKIDVEEAEQLLSLIDRPPDAVPGNSRKSDHSRPAPRYLRVVVEPQGDKGRNSGGERVNVRVPMLLLRAGVKLTALIPQVDSTRINDALRDKGVDLNVRNLTSESLEQLVDSLRDLEIDVQSDNERVRVYAE